MKNKYVQKNNPKRQKLLNPLQPNTGFLESASSGADADLDVKTRIKTLADLQKHLYSAMQLELSTIPPYLCGLYTIKEGSNTISSALIRSVVVEEMLHMILAANILNAVTEYNKGDKVITNVEEFIPKYPTKVLPGNIVPTPDEGQPPFDLHLRKFSPEAIEDFCEIEKPTDPDKILVRMSDLKFIESVDGSETETPYNSIGQFYQAIRYGLDNLEKNTPGGIFKGDHSRQVTPEQYYGSGGKILPVYCLEDANQAIEEIVGQGEGVHGTIGDPDNQMFGEGMEYAHYFKFQEIRYGKKYSPNDTNLIMPAKSIPTGHSIDLSWSSVYNMKLDPTMDDYKNNEQLWNLGLDFNRTYVKLINNINDAISGDPGKLKEGIAQMYDLKYKAVALMNVPLHNDKGECAGPTFQYVD
jgi:hypothetical protein